MVVTDGATSLGNELHTTLMGTLDIVTEGEEGVRAESHLGILGNPLFLLSKGEYLRLLREELLPCTVTQYVVMLVLRDIHVDGVVTVSTADALLERQCHHFRMLTEPPDICFVTGKTGTVDAALLSGTDTDSLSVLHIAYGVRLGILQCDKGDDEVALCLGSEGLVLGGDVLEECGSSSLISLRPCSKVMP